MKKLGKLMSNKNEKILSSTWLETKSGIPASQTSARAAAIAPSIVLVESIQLTK